MLLGGTLNIRDIENFYTKDWVVFYSDNTDIAEKQVSKNIIEDWALMLNSPWYEGHEKYIIQWDKEVNQYKCKYEVIGYDYIVAELYAYATTPVDALNKCICLFESIQKKYNPQKRSV